MGGQSIRSQFFDILRDKNTDFCKLHPVYFREDRDGQK
jgi:hypothetical protein